MKSVRYIRYIYLPPLHLVQHKNKGSQFQRQQPVKSGTAWECVMRVVARKLGLLGSLLMIHATIDVPYYPTIQSRTCW